MVCLIQAFKIFPIHRSYPFTKMSAYADQSNLNEGRNNNNATGEKPQTRNPNVSDKSSIASADILSDRNGSKTNKEDSRE